jgi:hypothetical protein
LEEGAIACDASNVVVKYVHTIFPHPLLPYTAIVLILEKESEL